MRDRWPLALLLATLGLYLLLVVPRLIWLDGEGLWVGHEHLWSDWPLHIAMLRRFSDCPPDQWLAQHPMAGGLPLRYPFVAAFVSGMLVRAGASVPAAIIAPTLLCFALLLPGLWLLWKRQLGSAWLALVPIFLFFLSAGPGGIEWLKAAREGGVAELLLPSREYGRADEYQWYASNFLVGMLLTQRAFLPGMTLAIWTLVGLGRALDETGPKRRQILLLLCGLGAGLLPIVHMHSLLALLVFGAAMALAAGRKPFCEALLWAGLPALLLGGALYLAFLRPPMPYPGFVSLKPFFVAESAAAWPKMWWKLWGLALPTALAGLLIARRSPLAWGGALLFLLANLILFQPIPWDNSKVFLWAYFGLTGAMAGALAWLWKLGWPGRANAVVLFVLLSLTGLANFVHLARTDVHRAMILSTDDMRLGEEIREGTPPDSIFLTAADISNAPMTWGARPIWMGFGGWMPNFGVPPEAAQAREATLRAILTGKPDARELARKNNIGYIFIGPSERSDSWKADEAAVARLFPLWLQQDGFSIYKASP